MATGFEPIAGTIGAVALLDPMLRGFSWLYGKYKLGKAFGRDYVVFQMTYESEVALFSDMLNMKLGHLSQDPVEHTGRRLEEACRNRLLLMLYDFEDCEKLIERYSSATTNKVVTPTVPVDNVAKAGSPIMSVSPAVSASTSSNPKDFGVESLGVSSDMSKLKKFFHIGKHGKANQNNRTSQDLASAASTLQDERNAMHYDVAGARAPSHLIEKGQWALSDRESFVKSLNSIEKHRLYFLSILSLRSQRDEATDNSGYLDSRVAASADNAARLLRTLAAHPDSKELKFHMRLIDDPFDFRNRIGDHVAANVLLRTSSSMFALRIGKVPATTDTTISLFSEVPPCNSQEHLDDLQRSQTKVARLSPFYERLLDHQTQGLYTVDSGYCHPAGILEEKVLQTTHPLPASRQYISLFHDSTIYTSIPKTLQRSLQDDVEAHLRNVSFTALRIRLAFVVASTFVQFLLAGFPLDFTAEALHFFSESPKGAQQAVTGMALARERVSPYVPLRAVGARELPTSSAALFSSVAETASIDQIRLQKLGVLLYEIGVWKAVEPIGNDDWRSRSGAVNSVKAILTSIVTKSYFDAVNACLTWTPSGAIDTQKQAAWIWMQVVKPLKTAMDTLPAELHGA